MAAVLLAGCVLPARSFAAFEGKAVASAQGAQSAVATARLSAQEATNGDLTAAYTSVAMADAEKDANHAQSTFDSIQPPDARSDRLRDRLDRLLTRATSLLAQMRIAARRGHLDRLERLARPLGPIQRQLERFQTVHSS